MKPEAECWSAGQGLRDLVRPGSPNKNASWGLNGDWLRSRKGSVRLNGLGGKHVRKIIAKRAAKANLPHWTPAKPKTRIKVFECGPGHWDEQDHGLDIPQPIDTIDFRITGTGHERIERAYTEGCRNNWQLVAFFKDQRELEIAAWLCQHACSFVLIDTKARATVIGFEREEDADSFRTEFVR